MNASATTNTPVPSHPVADIAPTVARLRETFESGRTRPLAWRRKQLEGLLAFAKQNSDALVAALQADMGKPELEARAADVGQITTEAKLALKNLKKWTKPEGAGWIPILGRSFVQRDPLGVVLIIAPWNYPVGLLISPLIGAIAAGNAAVLKPSEVTPHTSKAIADLLPKYVDQDAIAVIEGGVEETTALLGERFDHIFYTGNGSVGRIVMEAAARTLTRRTSRRAVAMMSVRERSGSSLGARPARASSGPVSSRIRPLDSAMPMPVMVQMKKGPEGPLLLDSEGDFTALGRFGRRARRASAPALRSRDPGDRSGRSAFPPAPPALPPRDSQRRAGPSP